MPAEVVCPGLIEPFAAAAARVRHVPPGQHRVLAFAPGHRTCLATLGIAGDERRELTLVLPRR